jgi:hypothetical protein
MELLDFIAGVFFPTLLIVTVYVSLLGQERLRLLLRVEYYRAVKANADKERKMAATGSYVTTRIRDLEKQAIAVLEKERLIRFVEPKPAAETPPAPPAPEGKA